MEEFASTWDMSCPLDENERPMSYPVVNHTEEQIKILFSSVPEVFPSNFRYSTLFGKLKNLTKEQQKTLEKINKVAPNPDYELKPEYIPRIIRKGELYARESFSEKIKKIVGF